MTIGKASAKATTKLPAAFVVMQQKHSGFQKVAMTLLSAATTHHASVEVDS